MSQEQREKFRWGFTYLHQQFIPALTARGVSSDAISGILTENPRRLFQAAGVRERTP